MKINLDDYVDVVGGKLKSLDLTDDINFQFRYRGSSEVVVRIERRDNDYYGTIYIPKRYFGKEKK